MPAQQNWSYGDLLYAELDPAAGHEQTKRRPLIVVSNNRFNFYSNLTYVCPITNSNNGYRLHVDIGSIVCDDTQHIVHGFAAVEQVKSLDLQARFATKVGTVSDSTMQSISDMLLRILLRDDQMVFPDY